MKKLLLSIFIFSSISFETFSHVGHYAKFNYLEYELFRNNTPIGYHKFDFKREGQNLIIDSEIKFKITKLGIDLYQYYAAGQERYNDGIFSGFSSETNQNKKEKYVNIKFDEKNKKLTIDGSSYKGDADENFIVGTWWNHEIIQAKAQISAISGRIIHQKVTFLGKEKLEINGKKYNALHFNFSSSDPKLPDKKKLNTDIWYDENTNLWLKASFDKTGYWEYRIKNYT